MPSSNQTPEKMEAGLPGSKNLIKNQSTNASKSALEIRKKLSIVFAQGTAKSLNLEMRPIIWEQPDLNTALCRN